MPVGQLLRQRHGRGQAVAGCNDAVFSVYGYTSMDSFIAAAQARLSQMQDGQWKVISDYTQ